MKPCISQETAEDLFKFCFDDPKRTFHRLQIGQDGELQFMFSYNVDDLSDPTYRDKQHPCVSMKPEAVIELLRFATETIANAGQMISK